MRVMVNGEEAALDSPCSVLELLERFQVAGGVCAVEVNAELVPRRNQAEHQLHEGDTVEIVTLVGGG